MTELLPCPHCGGYATVVENSWTHGYYVTCPNHHIFEYYPDYKNKDLLIAQWNKRTGL